jgi:hypothetical protein
MADRANFCDYFRPNPRADTANHDTATRAARSQLDALFGGDAHEAPPAVDQDAPSPADAARKALEDLFKK